MRLSPARYTHEHSANPGTQRFLSTSKPANQRTRLPGLCTAAHKQSATTFIRHNVAPGVSIESDGALLVLGNVAAGASLAAVGDIVVNGRLQGAAHAGAAGDHDARISALDMRGAQLQIAGVQWRGQVGVTGPHLALLCASGGQPCMDLQPLLPTHEGGAAGSTFQNWMRHHPAPAAALFTGSYAIIAGLALIVAPHTVLGLLFRSARQLSEGWIRIGGILFTVIGLQYLGTALGDWHAAQPKHRPEAVASSSNGIDSRTEPTAPISRGAAAHPLAAAGAGSTSFYVASVWSRAVLVVAFIALVLLGHCESGLLVLAAINTLGAAGMWRALRRQQNI